MTKHVPETCIRVSDEEETQTLYVTLTFGLMTLEDVLPAGGDADIQGAVRGTATLGQGRLAALRPLL